jgi:lipopolysaccharide transport system ATP-binding protein
MVNRIKHPLSTDLKDEAEIFDALKDINFEINQGDRIGIIGRNGAGKSTLLKVLSRITEPTTGTIGIKGRVASLLEVGTGFHPELTGRENIFLNGSILGMSRRDIQTKFDEIVAFAGVNKFLDTPVKRYSSGMYVRLAFSVAAHLEPEILIVDEVLAVGDMDFQNKCIGKMRDIGDEGRTVVFVSHNIEAIWALTSNCMHIKNGTLALVGPTEDVITNYLSQNSTSSQYVVPKEKQTYIKKIQVETDLNNGILTMLSTLSIVVDIFLPETFTNLDLSINIYNSRGQLSTLLTTLDSKESLANKSGLLTVKCNIPSCKLSPGEYTITVHLGAYKIKHLESVENVCHFTVTDNQKSRIYSMKSINSAYIEANNWSIIRAQNDK